MDHWHYVREGVDWDGLALKSPAGRAEYVTGAFPDGGKSLKITGNATFRTSRYAYDGEALLFGGWAKYANRTRGSREWAWSNLQLVLFDRAGKKIGHRDLTPLERGELPWRYFSTLIPEGSFRRDTAGFEIWARGFEGSKGESFFDEVQILRFNPENGTRRRYDASAATLRIDPGKAKSGPIRPVWNGTDISYAEKIASPWSGICWPTCGKTVSSTCGCGSSCRDAASSPDWMKLGIPSTTGRCSTPSSTGRYGNRSSS
ncbi:MAG: hypothetical protein L6W00_21865 [Lentisphaeria bacterium]|nr:MAG: hypothetical protein L6W00_21865 [Lentisphaeria bacterium]